MLWKLLGKTGLSYNSVDQLGTVILLLCTAGRNLSLFPGVQWSDSEQERRKRKDVAVFSHAVAAPEASEALFVFLHFKYMRTEEFVMSQGYYSTVK